MAVTMRGEKVNFLGPKNSVGDVHRFRSVKFSGKVTSTKGGKLTIKTDDGRLLTVEPHAFWQEWELA